MASSEPGPTPVNYRAEVGPTIRRSSRKPADCSP
jgi:hypothetical protein